MLSRALRCGEASPQRLASERDDELIVAGQRVSFRVMSWLRLFLSLTLHSLRSPATGLALLRVGWRFRRRGWWQRAPFLPLPDVTYVRWRMHTAYGSDDVVPPAEDVIRYARWAVRGA